MTTTSTPDSPRGTTGTTIAVSLALLGSVLLLGLAGLMCIATATYETDDDDSLAGLGYVFAIVVAAPGLLSGLLAVPALALRHRAPRTALGLSVAAIGVVVVFAVLVAFFLEP